MQRFHVRVICPENMKDLPSIVSEYLPFGKGLTPISVWQPEKLRSSLVVDWVWVCSQEIDVVLLVPLCFAKHGFLLYLQNHIRTKVPHPHSYNYLHSSDVFHLWLTILCMHPSNTEHYWSDYVHTGYIAGWDQHMRPTLHMASAVA